jgi:hypothetical protein
VVVHERRIRQRGRGDRQRKGSTGARGTRTSASAAGNNKLFAFSRNGK